MLLVFASATDAAGQSQFAIDEAREGGGTIWEWLLLLGCAYLTGLVLLFPALLTKYRHHRSESGYFTTDAFLVILLGIPIVLLPSAIVVGVVNFGFFGGRNDVLIEWWLTGVVVLVAAAACVVGLRGQLKGTTDPFPSDPSMSKGA